MRPPGDGRVGGGSSKPCARPDNRSWSPHRRLGFGPQHKRGMPTSTRASGEAAPRLLPGQETDGSIPFWRSMIIGVNADHATPG